MISSVMTSFINASFIQLQNSNKWNKESFLRTLLISGDISLNPGPVYNNQSLDKNEWNVFKSK